MTTQSTARDVFMYLLVLVVLAMSATALGMLLFDMVNVYLPDALRQVCAYDGCVGSINAEIAVLLISFPVLAWAWRFVQSDLKANPSKGDLWVRRWLLYLSLFVSGIAAIIDLIALVTNFLNGELTLAFVLKVAIVLGIALAVFVYFLRALHPKKGRAAALVAWGSTLVVIAALAAGVYTSAPWEARERSADQDRVNDLSFIQSELLNFWMAKGSLPVQLAELEDSVSGFRVPVDPMTGEAYEYNRKGAMAFELCATFQTATIGGGKNDAVRPAYPYPADPYADNWSHDVGRTCFQRDIDPQLYPPKRQ